ncbi:MAG: DUF2933 domain-containing protein [Bacteroidetes bacterium]|nr:DUF2933 domain-containing protein [Bacteroidota bacterium]
MSKKHTLIMLICCLIPIAALVAIVVFEIPATPIVYGVILLACPLSHLLMMKFMVHGHEQQDSLEHRHPTAFDVDAK